MPRSSERRILLSGAELEGGWRIRPNGDGERHGDGSVSIDYDALGIEDRDDDEYPEDEEGSADQPFIGEYVSPPMSPSMLPEWVVNNYPTATNETCGLHVHVSVRSPYYYSRLMDGARNAPIPPPKVWRKRDIETSPFYPYLVSNLKRWGLKAKLKSGHPFWKRLEGMNRYCRLDFDPDLQAHMTSKDSCRYGVLNFAYRQHSTMEVRVLPGFEDGELAGSAVAFLLKTIERYLQTLPDEDIETQIASVIEDPPFERKEKDTFAPWEEALMIPESLPRLTRDKARLILQQWQYAIPVETRRLIESVSCDTPCYECNRTLETIEANLIALYILAPRPR
jgi:hypothetical protein